MADIDLKIGDIVQNFEPTELVEIDNIKQFGSKILISAIGNNSKKRFNKPFSLDEISKLIKIRGVDYPYDGDPQLFLLGVEAERISIAYQFDPMFAVNSSVVDELPHQVEAVYKYLLPLPRIRFLLADDTGAGKTIMAGLLLKELFFRGTIQKALIVTPGGLTKQWVEDELQEKFGLQFRLIDRAVFKSNPNEFNSSDRVVTSIDFLRQPDVLSALDPIQWDIIIVDEAHKLSAYEYGTKIDKGERYKAIEILSKKTDHLLLLTATPHRGRKDTFRRLMMLLDEDLFTKDEHVEKRVHESYENFEFENKIEKANNRFFLRRLKEDMINWDSSPLYVQREAKTIGYDLTPEEFQLYNAVTGYVQRLRKEAKEKRNKNVELMLMVMQRRLASSIYAITQTLINRSKRLEEVLALIKEARANQTKLNLDYSDEQIPESIDEVDENADDQVDKIFDRKISRFVLSLDPGDIQKELNEVKELVSLADTLRGHEEQKFIELKKLLDETDLLRDDDERLLIFTEHRDTLENLKERLENKGFKVSIIHGGMNVDERKKVQREFRLKNKIMIATDAAGEGINLQFCRYLINWDIPWNPNRLEQRMGRIHRYGQKNKVRVFNIVAQNTREGLVLKKLLDKLDVMREQLGSDRVYDVIDELLEDVSLSELISLHGDDHLFEEKVENTLKGINDQKALNLISIQKKQSLVSKLDLRFTTNIRNLSDERRLQPLYIERFFTKAFSYAGGFIKQHEQFPVIYLGQTPKVLLDYARELKIPIRDYYNNPFVFNKSLVSIASPVNVPDGTKLLGPGHPLFDCLLNYLKKQAAEVFARGAQIIDPNISEEERIWLIKSTVKDNRIDEKSRIAHQRIDLIISDKLGIRNTSAAYLIDCTPNNQVLSTSSTPISQDEISTWAYENLTEKQLQKVKSSRESECEIRSGYIKGAFTDLINDLQSQINDLDELTLYGDNVAKEREALEEHIDLLKKRRIERLNELDLMLKLDAELPEILTSAVVFPNQNKIEIQLEDSENIDDSFYSDAEVEKIAMDISIRFEKSKNADVTDVSADNVGYDIKSQRSEGEIRYIEIKGRAHSGAIILTENEVNRLRQLGDRAWLYIVINCKTQNPILNIICNPISVLDKKEIIRQVQYIVSENSWKPASQIEKL